MTKAGEKNGGRRIEIVGTWMREAKGKKMMAVGLSEIVGFACIDGAQNFFFPCN